MVNVKNEDHSSRFSRRLHRYTRVDMCNAYVHIADIMVVAFDQGRYAPNARAELQVIDMKSDFYHI